MQMKKVHTSRIHIRHFSYGYTRYHFNGMHANFANCDFDEQQLMQMHTHIVSYIILAFLEM